MAVMEKLRMFVAQEPVVAASCLIGGVGLFLPAVVRPILDSLEASKQVKAPPLTDFDSCVTPFKIDSFVMDECHDCFKNKDRLVIAGVTGKKQS